MNLKKWMAATFSVKKIILDDRMDGSSCSSQRTREKMNDWSLLLSLNEITHFFKKWTTGSGVLKKICYLYKNVMLQIDPLKSSCSQKQHYPERTLRLKVLGKSSSLEKQAVPKVTLPKVQLFTNDLLKYLLYFMKNCNYCCQIVKLTESNCSKSHPCKWKCLQLLS